MREHIYNISPVFIQNLMCSLYGYKEKSKRFGAHFSDILESLRSSQYYSEDEIINIKNNSFKNIIGYSYENVPYYKRTIDELGLSLQDFQSLEDIVKLPILTKDVLRENLQDFVSISYPRSKIVTSHTSGSTGKALDFYTNEETIQHQWAVWWRFRERFGVKLGDKHLNFTGKLVVPMNQVNPPFWRYNRAINQSLINMQHIKPQNIRYFVDYINKEKFVFFSGYPSIIYALCLQIEEQGLKISTPPEFVFTGAEKLYENQRACISRVLSCIVTDQYGFSEGAGNASRCTHDVFHEDFEFGHLECLDSRYVSNTEREGQILATGFQNYTMPLLRYQVGDFASFSTVKCSCGLHSQVIKNIEGRSEDYVLTPEGTKILRFDYLFKDTKNISECQVVQYKLGEVTFRIVKRNNYSNKDENNLLNEVKKWISPTISVNFEYVKEIERTNTGKFRAVRSFIKENQVN